MAKSISVKEAEIFKALAHQTRLQILACLRNKNQSVSELNQLLHKRQPNISQHLFILKKAGLVSVQKAGKQRVYRINNRWKAVLDQLKTSSKS